MAKMPMKLMARLSFDSDCRVLALAFLTDALRCDGQTFTDAEADSLAQDIQDAVEGFFAARNSQRANGPIPAGQDAGPAREAPPTGVDHQKCLGGGVVSENADVASIRPLRVMLTYCGAHVIDIDGYIHIVLCKFNNRSDLRRTLHQAGWQNVHTFMWERQRSDAAIASAREILGRYFGPEIV